MVEDEYAAVSQPSAPTDGGGFVAFVPGLPGCISDGETREEAADAISEWIDEAQRPGREIPAAGRLVA